MQNRGVLIVLLLVVIIGGFMFWQTRSKNNLTVIIEQGKQLVGMSQVVKDSITASVNPVLQQAQPYVQDLASGGADVASRAATVLGTTTGLGEVTSQPTTLLEGTAQYARYWYCKQVVESYEKQYQK